VFGLTFEKLLLIGVLAVFLLGPERLPQYAAGLARLVKGIRNMATGAKERMREEMGDDVDWRTLDPRQYDPRRIIRDALLDNPQSPSTAATTASTATVATASASSATASRGSRPARATAGSAPYDREAT
jgi:sec-independent protein translocase protein TatB